MPQTPLSRLETLPQEMFFHVVSFLGPSRDLLSLTLTSRQIHTWLELIGNSIAVSILRYRNFRTLLKVADTEYSPLHESKLCMVVRHAEYVDHVRCTMKTLRSLIGQDFEDETAMDDRGVWVTQTESMHSKRKLERSTFQEYQPQLKKIKRTPFRDMDIRTHLSNNISNPRQCIDVTLYLLSLCLGLSCPDFENDHLHGPQSSPISNDPSISASTMEHFLHLSCPRSVQRLFFFLCGKLCAKAYKWVKARVSAEQLSRQNVSLSNTIQSLTCHQNNLYPLHSVDEQRLVHLRHVLHHVFKVLLEIPSA